MTKQEFKTWATGKLPTEQIDAIIAICNRAELLHFKNNWSE